VGTLTGVTAADTTSTFSASTSQPTDPGCSPGYVGIVATYDPRKSKFALCAPAEWEVVAPVVRATVARLEGFADRGLRPYLTAMTRLSVWALREGLPLVPASLLSDPVIEAHVATLDANAGTFRSQLRRLAAANGVALGSTAVGYARPGYSAPYTLDEVRALLLFASSLTNEIRRRQLTGLLLLGAACGFSRADLRGVCNGDVHHHSGVRYVRTRNRCTPILEDFSADFDAYLSWCGDEPFVGVKPGANITDRMVSWVGERAGLPRLSADRLRAFFVVEHLRRNTPLPSLLAYCGFASLEALDPYLAFLPASTPLCGSCEEGSL